MVRTRELFRLPGLDAEGCGETTIDPYDPNRGVETREPENWFQRIAREIEAVPGERSRCSADQRHARCLRIEISKSSVQPPPPAVKREEGTEQIQLETEALGLEREPKF